MSLSRAADFKNVSIVAHYIKERTKDAQFIIISLRNNMFELADRLVRPVAAVCPVCSLVWRVLALKISMSQTRPWAWAEIACRCSLFVTRRPAPVAGQPLMPRAIHMVSAARFMRRCDTVRIRLPRIPSTAAQVGIYKTDNATKSLAINPGEFVIGRPKGQPQSEGTQAMMQSPLQTRDSNVRV